MTKQRYCEWPGCDRGPDGGPMPLEEDWEWKDHSNGGAYHDSEQHIAHKHLFPNLNPAKVHASEDANEIAEAYLSLWEEANRPGGAAMKATVLSLASKSSGRSAAAMSALKELVALAASWTGVSDLAVALVPAQIGWVNITNMLQALSDLREIDVKRKVSTKKVDESIELCHDLITGQLAGQYAQFLEWMESQ